MPFLFSYGTLQQDDVQRSTFGRSLIGTADALPNFEAAKSSDGQHANVKARHAGRVRGTVFEVTDADLASADAFEAPFAYVRILATLESGKKAWVYIEQTA